jgi:hypothetical protein
MAFELINGLRTVEFGNPGESRSNLIDLIVNGNKRATAGTLKWDYEDEGEPIETVGEKFAVAADVALAENRPLITFCASGGARMQEGLVSLMQMAKTSHAVAKLRDANIPYIVVLTHPSTGGAVASYEIGSGCGSSTSYWVAYWWGSCPHCLLVKYTFGYDP